MATDLTGEKTQRLEAELNRRHKLAMKEKEEKEEEEQFKRWRRRPMCAVVGRAYGSPYYRAEARELSLATVIIEGNMSWRYPVKLTVAPSVETYFHNAWTKDDEREFTIALEELVKGFVLAKCNDPAIVTTLICLSESAGMRPLTGKRKEVYDGWHKEALTRLSKFSKDELVKAKKKLEDNHETAHGQIRLLSEAMK